MADDEAPISPLVETKPELTITAPSVNDQPVELDSTPASAERIRDIRRGAKQEAPSPEEEKKRQALISERKEDKGVLVDVATGSPSAEEFQRTEETSASTKNK